MLFQSTLLAAFALASSVRAQPSPTAYVEPTVPTGKPIAGDYGGVLRPQIHFSPPKNFMVSCASVSRPVYGFNTFGGVASVAVQKGKESKKTNADSTFLISVCFCQSMLIFWVLRTIPMACSWMPTDSTIFTTNV